MLSGDVKLQLMGAQSVGVLYRQCYIGGRAGEGHSPPMTGLGVPCTLSPQLWQQWTVTKHTFFGKTFRRTFLERGSICRLHWTSTDQKNAFSFREASPPDPGVWLLARVQHHYLFPWLFSTVQGQIPMMDRELCQVMG